MAGLFDWSTVASENGTIDGINTDTGMPVSNTDNAFRSIAALIRQSFTSALENFLSGAAPLPLANGGTGGASASAARTNLGLGTLATQNTAPIAQGGTGATTAATAFANIAVSSSSIGSGSGYLVFTNGLKLTWGSVAVGANSTGSYSVPTSHTTWIIPVTGWTVQSGNSGQNENAGITSVSISSIGLYNAENFSRTAYIITIGV